MDIKEIRQKNINYWADKLGRDILAEKMGYKDTTYINLLCGGHGSFGSATARKAETALGLTKGWFDVAHDDVFDEKLERLIKIMGQLNEDQKDRLLKQAEDSAAANRLRPQE